MWERTGLSYLVVLLVRYLYRIAITMSFGQDESGRIVSAASSSFPILCKYVNRINRVTKVESMYIIPYFKVRCRPAAGHTH